MAQRKRKKHRMAGNGNRKNPADSAGTDGAIEGQSPLEIVKMWYPVLHELQNKRNRN